MPTPTGYRGYQGAAPRKSRRTIAISLAVLILIVLIVVYALAVMGTTNGSSQGPATYLAAPGQSCHDPKLPAGVLELEQSSAFIGASGGSCYSYISETADNASQGSNMTLTFDLYNGSVFYPCGNAPVDWIADQIQVTATPALVVESVALNSDAPVLNSVNACQSEQSSIGLSSVQYLEVTIPALPELNVTLDNPATGQPVTSIRVAFDLGGTSSTLPFTGITTSNPLLPGQIASATQVIGTQTTGNSTELYQMTISGTYLDGTTFSIQAQFVVTTSGAPNV